MDVILSQTRIDFDNLVDDTIVKPDIFYKQGLPLFQEMINSCSAKI